MIVHEWCFPTIFLFLYFALSQCERIVVVVEAASSGSSLSSLEDIGRHRRQLLAQDGTSILLLPSLPRSAVGTAFVPTHSQYKLHTDNRKRRRYHQHTTQQQYVKLSLHSSERLLVMQQTMIPILHETDRLLVINKPPGISHHNDDKNNELGIITLLRKQLFERDPTEQQNSSKTTSSSTLLNTTQSLLLYGVHRLDRETSGILIVAKDKDMASELSKAFREKKVCKYYIGISNKKPKQKKQGWVKGYMERSRQKSWMLTRGKSLTKSSSSTTKVVIKQRPLLSLLDDDDDDDNDQNENNNSNLQETKMEEEDQNDDDDDDDDDVESSNSNTSRPSSFSNKPTMAVTRFFTASLNVLNNNNNNNQQQNNHRTQESPGASIVEPKTCLLFRPYTGKTHQLRVAAKSVGLALLGDPIYRDGTKKKQQQKKPQSTLPTTTTATTTTTQNQYRMYLHASAIHIELSDGPLTIWSPPPFDDLWWRKPEEEGTITTTTTTTPIDDDDCNHPPQQQHHHYDSFQDIVQQLMEKYCDEPSILEAMMNHHYRS